MSIINIFAPNWEVQDSYGRIASELADGLSARGYYVNPFGYGAQNKPIQIATGGLFLGYPTQFNSYAYALNQVGPRLAITMFESTKLLDGWAEQLNQCDAVVVPAQFLVDVFQANGVKTAIEVHPLGISSDFLTHDLRVADPERPLTFLAIVDRGLRKGGWKALEAFSRAFGEDERYRLVLKSRKDGTLARFKIANRNVETIAEDYSNAEMAQLYRRCDAMIFPSCGEGFGLPPREFAATGGLALATHWGGTADDIEQWGIPLPYRMTTAWADKVWYGKQGTWASVDVDELAHILQSLANNFEAFTERVSDASAFVAEQYSWSAFVDAIESIWKRISAKEIVYARN